jgi:ribose/xylose/arabinose/galactoside ABC-type transport system permease subunit
MKKQPIEWLKSFTKRNEFISLALCVVFIVLLSVRSNYFWSPGNLDSLQVSIARTVIVAFGMMLLLICGYFDLSVGSTMLLAGMLAGQFYLAGFSMPVVIILVLLSGAMIGCLNGLCVAVLKLNPLIVTVGTQQIGYGIANFIYQKTLRGKGFRFPPEFIKLGEGKFLGLFYMTWIALLLLFVFSYYLTYTSSGRRRYFVGGNRDASRLIGFNDKWIVFISYVVTGVLAALASILFTARIMSPGQNTGENIHMTCIIACVVGGGSFAGGKGSALGAILGVAFMSLLTNMFNLLEMNLQFQNVIIGLIPVAVITIDGYLLLKKQRELGRI